MQGVVLVTGASGFVGRDLTQRLQASGWHVRAAARDAGSIAETGRVERVALPDLASEVDWAPLVRGVSHVVHLAGIAHSTRAIPEATYHAVNAEAVRTLAVAAKAAGIERVVMVSSIRAQCGASAIGIVDEAAKPEPVDGYGRAKLAGEQFLASALDGSSTDWCALRPVLVYGPGVKGNMATLARLARSRMPLPIGGLHARRSLVSLGTLASAIEHALVSPRCARGTFIAAEPEPLTVPRIVAAMRRGMGRGPGLISLPLGPLGLLARAVGKGAAWERVAGDLVVSTARLEATGWRAAGTAADGIEAWMTSEPA